METDNRSPLFEAINKHQNDIVMREMEADPSLFVLPLDEDNNTLLHVAAQCGNIKLVEFVLEGTFIAQHTIHLDINAQSSLSPSYAEHL
jgi:hypothetical protein